MRAQGISAKKRVNSINPFLIESPVSNEPNALCGSAGLAFKGKEPYGKGFYFSDQDQDANSIQDMKAIIESDPNCGNAIRPCIGGDEVLSDPSQSPYRYLIDFGDMAEAEARQYAALFEICSTKVASERSSKSADVARWPYWKHWRPRSEMAGKLKDLNEYIFHAFTSTYVAFSFVDASIVSLSPHVVIASAEKSLFSVLSSRVHSLWVEILSSTMGATLRYTASDCFETFPFPEFVLGGLLNDEGAIWHQSLQIIGERYHRSRTELMVKNDEGLTSIYNRFHDPAETSPGLLELRHLHSEMDQAVLKAYGWSDVSTACGFGLDYLDTADDAQLPDELQERIDSGELFFWDAGDALDFQGQLEAYGAISGRRKLPWRYRWPDAVRDDVLARLLALNAERYAEEVAQGLHSKGGSKASGTAAAGGKRRGRPAKAADSADTEQIGLAL